MAGRYKRKTSPLTLQKLYKLIQSVLSEGDTDRRNLETLFTLFTTKVDEGANNVNYAEDVKSLLDVAKLMQNSRTNSIKSIEALCKAADLMRDKKFPSGRTSKEVGSQEFTSNNLFELLDLNGKQ